MSFERQDQDQDQDRDRPQQAAATGLNLKAKEFQPFNLRAAEFVPRPRAAAEPAAAVAVAVAAPAEPAVAVVAAVAAPAEPAVVAAAPAAPIPAETVTTATTATTPPVSAIEQQLLSMHFKEHFNVIFIGHVDAGKSTLGGNVLFLTDMVDKRTLEKYEREAKEAGRESWYLSWALDTNAEERAKGKTVECGRAYFETAARRYTILDAPGHKNFVPSMLGGAAQADVGVLVISARKGEFETGFDRGGQTREHAVLAKTAGVRQLVVAVNKMDDPTVAWDRARFEHIVGKLTPFLRATGYSPKSDLHFLPVSGYTGANVRDAVDPGVCAWYSGPPLLQLLDTLDSVDRKLNAPLRMPIAEKYRNMGTVVAGKIDAGTVRVGSKLVVMPDKRTCYVTTIYGEDDEEKEIGACGDNVRLRLRGVEEEDIDEGYVLTDPTNPCRATTEFEAQVVILDAKNIITAGYSAVMHVHTCAEEVLLSQLLHLVDKKGRRSRRPPPFVKKGQACIARFTCARSVCIERFADYPQLGRFTLRDEGKTIAIGKVTRIPKQAASAATNSPAAQQAPPADAAQSATAGAAADQ